jgi:serine protease Do
MKMEKSGDSIKHAGLFCAATCCSLLLNCQGIFADANHPARGSIEFGATENPLKNKTADLGPFKTIFADIAEKIVPTVVSVIITKIDTVSYNNNPFYQFFNDPFSNNDPFQFFFGTPPNNNNRPRQRRQPPVEKREFRQQGLGSGVIVSKNGYILTNFHVISGANEIEIKLDDGRTFQGAIIGGDSLADVAVIKIKGKVENLPVAYLGNSDSLRPGDWVLAVGNPFSLTSTVTAGIVSALNRMVEGGEQYQNFIQTDAAINPGNSGGALVNIDGALIGINTMIYSSSGGNMGIGFAIPITMARQIMEELIYTGEVVRGWIGVSIQEINTASRDALNLGKREGVLIGDVFKGQPADKAGIKRGDIVLSINRNPLKSGNQLRNIVADIAPGTKVPVTVFRNGKELDLTITIGKRSEKQLEKMAAGPGQGKSGEPKEKVYRQLGIDVANLTPQLREKYGIDDSIAGIVITEVDQKSYDAASMLKEGDVIEQVKIKESDFVSVDNVDKFAKSIQGIKEGDAVMYLLFRGGNSFYIAYKAQK